VPRGLWWAVRSKRRPGSRQRHSAKPPTVRVAAVVLLWNIARARSRSAAGRPSWRNRSAIARRVVEIFFPQRSVLKLDGHSYSPTILHRILHMAGVVSSFDVAAVALSVVGEIVISDRQINKLTTEVGQQLQQDRDERTARYVKQDLPRRATEVTPVPDLAAVFCDGGRMRTREEGQGPGVHQPHWREPKNAGFHRMQSGSFAQDPQPDLPECFRNQAYVEKLVKGLKGHKKEGREEVLAETPSPAEVAGPSPERCEWQPKTLFRTCLSSLASSDDFGPMMAAEADARGFFAAKKKAFLGDGLPYNWTICTHAPRPSMPRRRRTGSSMWIGRMPAGRGGRIKSLPNWVSGRHAWGRSPKAKNCRRVTRVRRFTRRAPTSRTIKRGWRTRVTGGRACR
jgi:hypothetical protein